MTHKVSWYEPASVVFAQFKEHMTLADTMDANQREIVFMDRAKEKVYLVVDLRRLERQEGSLTQLRDIVTIVRHPKLEYLVIIRSPNPFITFISTTISQVFRVPFYKCEDLGVAAQFIQEHSQQDNAFGTALLAWLDNELL